MSAPIACVYLDNCCFNRPFDDQSQPLVKLESDAKLIIQALMRFGKLAYAWSFILSMEVSRNPDPQRREAIRGWMGRAAVNVMPSPAIRARAKELQGIGIKPADSIHLACAESAHCDWFFTVDKGILKKVKALGTMRVANPVTFVVEGLV